MKKKYFGTDGIRGTVGQEPITPDFVLRLGHAIGGLLRSETLEPTVLIGKDTRISGYMLESALESGLNAAGVNVVLLGPIPTPAVAYLTRALRADLGVVISASHNPHQDNGIKFFNSQGTKLDDSWEIGVENLLQQAPQWVDSAHLGRTRRLSDANGRYIEFCKGTFPQNYSLKGLKLVVDAANGAAYNCAPQVFHELGAEVIVIGNTPNGFNINRDCGATHPAVLQAKVLECGADFGIALDGDADRLQLVDSLGQLLNGDELLYIMVQEQIALGRKPQGVVGTVMTNMAVENALAQQGVELVRAKVGDRYVLEELNQRGWTLGGESSGHLLDLDHHSTGDGIVSALQVLKAVVRCGKNNLSDSLRDLVLYHQIMLNLRVADRDAWQHETKFLQSLQQAEAELGQCGRVLVRASGTEPLLRIMVEARDSNVAQNLVQKLASKVPQQCGN